MNFHVSPSLHEADLDFQTPKIPFTPLMESAIEI
jgi:hypothetical protein